MRREIYLNGKRFESIEEARAYLFMRWGKVVEFRELKRLADRAGAVETGTGEWAGVSWTENEAGRREEAVKEAKSRKGQRPPPLPPPLPPPHPCGNGAAAGEELVEELERGGRPCRAPLLRYPPGTGPRYDGSRGWR
jgi:hypothetical protein